MTSGAIKVPPQTCRSPSTREAAYGYRLEGAALPLMIRGARSNSSLGVACAVWGSRGDISRTREKSLETEVVFTECWASEVKMRRGRRRVRLRGGWEEMSSF